MFGDISNLESSAMWIWLDLCWLAEFQKGCVYAAKESTFMGLKIYFYDITPKVDIAFFSYTDFGHTLKKWKTH